MEVEAGAYRIGLPGRSPMPRGARHVETGTLRPGKWGYSLEVDGGGVWQLDIAGSARRYLGQRVTVEGIRSGFDLIDVHRVGPGNTLPSGLPSRLLKTVHRLFKHSILIVSLKWDKI